MSPIPSVPLIEDDIFVLTDLGKKELHGASTKLSRQALELLILIDGYATVGQVLHRAAGVPKDMAEKMLQKILQERLIGLAPPPSPDDLDFTGFLSPTPAPSPSEGALAAASHEAMAGEAALKRQGYYVRIARQAAVKRKLREGEHLSAVIIEDEPHLGKLLRQYLTLEGFHAEVASNRAEIVAAFRRPQHPDLVLLDVVLPDADGFDVLAKVRQHPALKRTRVIMLTGKATRESVLRGLAGGADGYITKPFEVDVLIKAAQTVLGLSA